MGKESQFTGDHPTPRRGVVFVAPGKTAGYNPGLYVKEGERAAGNL